MADPNAIAGTEPGIAAPAQEPEAADWTEQLDDAAPEPEEGTDAEPEEGDAEPDEEPDETADDDGEIELNIAGNARKFGKKQTAAEVAAELQKFADETWQAHTRRSQEVAERDKAVKARAEAIDKIQQMDDDAFKLFAAAKSYDETAATLRKKLAQVDRYTNPDKYRFISDDIAQYQAAAQQARSALNQRETQVEQARVAEVQRRHQEGAAQVKRAIKDFNPDEVIDYVAKRYGIDQQAAKSTWGLDPNVAQMAYKAMRWDQMQERARKKTAPPPKQPEPVAAVSRRGGSASATDLLTAPGKADAYHKARMEALRKR